MMEGRLVIVGVILGWLFITLLIGWIASAIESIDYDGRKDENK